MLLVDHFSNLAQVILESSEKVEDLKKTLITLSTPVRHPGPIVISTDNATGFQSLKRNKDPELTKLQISLQMADEINKNFNTVLDKACQDIEGELHKIRPKGGKMMNTDLAQAILAMNNKLRRAENVTAYEMHMSRRLETGQNIVLNDSKLRQSQIAARRHAPPQNLTHPSPKPGDTITNISQ